MLNKNVKGIYFKGASFLRNEEIFTKIKQLIRKNKEVRLQISPFRLTSDIIEKFFLEGIDFILISNSQLAAYLKKAEKAGLPGLPLVIVVDKMDRIRIEDLRNVKIADIISTDQITRESLIRTQYLLQSSFNSSLFNFLDNLNKDSFFESLFGKLEEAVSILDENARYIWINEAYTSLLGYTLEELTGRTPARVMGKGDMAKFVDFFKEGNTNYKGEHIVTDKGGKRIKVDLSLFVISDENTGLVRIASIKRKKLEEQQVEQQLILSEEKFRKFINSIDDLITVTDVNGIISFTSPGYQKSLGYKEGELIGTLIYEYVAPEDIRKVKQSFSKAKSQGFQQLRFRFRKKNGDYIWLESRGDFLKGQNLQDQGFILGASVIHDQVLSQEKLRETESRYKILVERIYDLLVEVDQRDVIINITGNPKPLLRRSSLSLIGKKFMDQVYKEDLKIFINGAYTNTGTCEVRMKSGSTGWRWFEVSVQSFRDLNNAELKIITLKDIDEKRRIIKRIKEGESLYTSLTENIQDIVIRVDKDMNVLYANSTTEIQLFENNKVKNLKDLNVNESAKERIFESIQNVKETLKPYQYEIKLEREGKAVYYNWSVMPEFNEHSDFFSYLILARNVTPFLVAKHEITKLFNILEHSTNSIMITDRDGRIEYINARVEELTGFTHHELIGKNPRLFKSGNTNPEEYVKLWDTITSGKAWKGTLCNRKKDGQLFWESVIISPIKNYEGEIINYLAVKQDITQLRTLEKALHSTQEKLNLTLETARVGTWEILIPEKRISWDDQVVKLCGYEIEELENGNLDSVIKIVHPEDIQRIINLSKQRLSGTQALELEFRVITKLGLTKNVFIKGQIISDETGDPVKLDGISMDITSQKAIEENLKLRNEELNQFVYKVSHDLRAPLASIRGIIELEKLQNKDNSQFKYVHLIEDRISNLDQFMRNILSHSRNLNTSVKFKLIDFQRIAEDCFKELEFLRNALSIKRILKISKFPFYSDESRMFEIFRNLISNSIKYLDYDKSEPFIRITVKKESSNAIITFEDNGVGIALELQNNIFDMFYRANEKSDGSGIGLYIVKQAVEKLNGSVQVKSKKGIGTRFQVIIPNANP